MPHPPQAPSSYPCQNIEGRGALSRFFSLCLVRYVGQHVGVRSIDASARLLVEDPRLRTPHQDTATACYIESELEVCASAVTMTKHAVMSLSVFSPSHIMSDI